jgi:hypothetical protein
MHNVVTNAVSIAGKSLLRLVLTNNLLVDECQ